MRSVNLNSVGYTPNAPPVDSAALPSYLLDELTRISSALTILAAGHIDITYAAPSKPRAGDIRYADGTTWNPGSGAGIYRYTGSTWTYVG